MNFQFSLYGLSKDYHTRMRQRLLDPTMVAGEVAISRCLLYSSDSDFRALPADLFTGMDLSLLQAKSTDFTKVTN